MPNNPVAQYGLRWKDDSSGELVPMWTTSPDISIVKSLAVQHLQSVHSKLDKMGPTLRPQQLFNHNANNKLFLIENIESKHAKKTY
jgi:hypothetical protein